MPALKLGLNVGHHSGVQVRKIATSVESAKFDPQGRSAQASKFGLNAGSDNTDGKVKTNATKNYMSWCEAPMKPDVQLKTTEVNNSVAVGFFFRCIE